MKKLLEAFSFKSIQESVRILKLLIKEGFSVEDFIKFASDEKEEFSKNIFKVSYKRENKKNVKVVKAVGKQVQNKFIIPGELEKMSGVVCSKCNGDIFITATCCKNPLKAQGFLRKGICEKCGNEFGIR